MIVNKVDLKGTEYKILKKFNKKIFSFSELLNDMRSNEYSRLENYYKDKFEFIKFKDEEVIIENDKKEEFIVFGRNSNGLFVINKNGEVWLIPFYISDIEKPIFINSSLYKFRCCYCLLLSILFFFLGQDVNQEECLKIAKKYKMDIFRIDSYSVNSLFYKNYIFSIENAELPIHFTPMDYVNNGRHFIPQYK